MYDGRRRRGNIIQFVQCNTTTSSNGLFRRRSLARSNLWKVVVLGEFAQLFVKLTNFILVRFTRHILNHSCFVRLLIRFLVRLLRLGSRIHVSRPVRASTILSALFTFKRASSPSRAIVSHISRREFVHIIPVVVVVVVERTSFFSFFSRFSFLLRFFSFFPTPPFTATPLRESFPRTTWSYASSPPISNDRGGARVGVGVCGDRRRAFTLHRPKPHRTLIHL